MSSPELIQKAFYDSMDEINELLAPEKKLMKSPSTIITGESSPLDSLLLLNLIISIEEKLKQNKVSSESLVEHIATSKEPELSVQMLTDFILNYGETQA